MPTFVDRHPVATMPRAVRHRMYLEAMSRGPVDKHGVQALQRWITNGVVYCVMQAPSQEAFYRYHADHDLPCDDVHPIVGADMDIVRAVVGELWPGDQRDRCRVLKHRGQGGGSRRRSGRRPM